jgi:hypothetical protein
MITSRNPSSYRIFGSGLGQTGGGIGPGTLNCPGDPQCFLPGGAAYTPTPPVGDLNFWGAVGGNIVGQQLAASPPPTPSSPIGSYLLGSPNVIWWAVGIVAAVVLLSGGRR